MSDRDDFELRLQQFFGEGPSEIDDAVIEASLVEIATTPQWRAVLGARPVRSVNFEKLLVAAGVVVSVTLVAARLMSSPAFVGRSPEPSTVAGASGNPAGSAGTAPVASPCLRDLVVGQLLSDGCRWRVPLVRIPMTLEGTGAWLLDDASESGFVLSATRPDGPGVQVELALAEYVPVMPCITDLTKPVAVRPAPSTAAEYRDALSTTPLAQSPAVPVSIADEQGFRFVVTPGPWATSSPPPVASPPGATAPPPAGVCPYVSLVASTDPAQTNSAFGLAGMVEQPGTGYVIDLLHHADALVVIRTTFTGSMEAADRRTANRLLEGLRFEAAPGASASGAPSSPASSASAVTFASPRYGYTVDVPALWVATPASQAWPGDDGIEPDDPPFADVFHLPEGASGSAMIKALTLPAGTTEADWLAQWQRTRTIGGHCFGSASPWWEATVAGIPARHVAWRCDSASDNASNYDEYAFLAGGRGFVVSGTPSMVDVLVRSFRAP